MKTEEVYENVPLLLEEDVHVVDQAKMKKALKATLLGNFMEWFDVGMFGYLSASLMAVFFPFGDPWKQLAFFGTFAATYLVRPLGGLVLGPIGDKVGRKKVLAFTIIMMAGGTFLIGCLPSYNTWGMAAPIILILLKLLQGFSTGGEYAGAATFITEYASDKRRGYWSSFLDFGSYLGFATAAALATVIEVILNDEQMLAFGWRICFWVALPLGLTGVIMRSHIEESHTFEAQQEANEAEAQKTSLIKDLVDVCAKHWRGLLIGASLVMCSQVVGYALTSFMPTYLTESLGYDTIHGNALLVPVLILVSFGLPIAGNLSDKWGRRPVMLTGNILGIVLAIPAFWFMMRGDIVSTFIGLMLVGIVLIFQASVLASSLPAFFPTASRYTAMGIMFNVAVAVFGGTTGGVITILESVFHSDYAGAWYIMIACIIGVIGTLLMKESAGRNLIGSMPAVETEEEVAELIDTQLENDRLDPSTMPIPVIRIEEAKTGSLPVVKQDDITPEEHVAHMDEVIDLDNYKGK